MSDLWNVLIDKVYCSGISGGIDARLPQMISILILIIQLAIPIIMVIWGSLDLTKAVMSQNADDIKKGQQTFIKRLLAGACAFFVVAIVKLVLNLVDENDSINSCYNCFINNSCGATAEAVIPLPEENDPTALTACQGTCKKEIDNCNNYTAPCLLTRNSIGELLPVQAKMVGGICICTSY